MSACQSGFTDLSNYTIDPGWVARLDEAFCRERGVVLLGPEPEVRGTDATLGMLDPEDDETVTEARRLLCREIRRVQLNEWELREVLGQAWPEDLVDAVDSDGARCSVQDELVLYEDMHIGFGAHQPAPKMVIETLAEAVTRRATDIHIEVYEQDVDLRFRIDGVLQQAHTPFSHANVRWVVSYIKVLSGLNIAEHRVPQDGRIPAVYADRYGKERQVDFRVSVLPGPHGEEVVLRVLDEKRILLGLNELGMPEYLRRDYDRMLHTPGGIIFITGPTASGKTTTLYASIAAVNTDQNKILTVEDPIEYQIGKVNQKQVGAVLGFADYARAFMRQNPDVVVIGEVRDRETVEIALRASQMGHLVLTTLHARDAACAVPRMVSLGADRSLLASGLLGSLSQRLIRVNCPACVAPLKVSDELRARLPGLSDTEEFLQGMGCAECDGTGYHGQTGVFELLRFDASLRTLVMEHGEAFMKTMPGYPRMIDDALSKAAAGLTSPEEIARAVPLVP